MKYEPINGGFKKLKKDLSKMTFKDKLNHLWTYYKSSLLILAVVILVGSIFVTSCRARNTRTILAGVGVNVALTEEGTSYVKEDYYARTATGGLEQVIYTESVQERFSSTTDFQTSYTQLMNLVALISAQELDYLLLDAIGVENLLAHGVFMDLRDFFTEAELEALGDKVIWMESTNSDDSKLQMPVAVNIEHLPFTQAHTINTKDTFFAVVSNTLRKETCRDFWAYLNAWTPAE